MPTLLPLAKLHTLLEELLALVWPHAAVWIENVESFTIAKTAARSSSLTVVAIYLVIAIPIVLIIVTVISVSV